MKPPITSTKIPFNKPKKKKKPPRNNDNNNNIKQLSEENKK